MDLAYDHIQEESYANPTDDVPADSKPEQQNSLNDDIQEAYRAISSSVWGAKIGGFIGTVVKQGENVYREAQQELSHVGGEATRGFSDLRDTIINRTRSLSLTTSPPANAQNADEARDPDGDKDKSATPTKAGDATADEALRESETVLSRLRAEAGKRLKEIQRAEDAADEALLKFGSNIRDFLQNAITIAPPSDSSDQGNTILFESKDAQGKRVIHSSRFDAQLHVIHTSTDSLASDPESDEYGPWSKDFDVEKKTSDISSDLAKHPELRATMEKLVPDQVPYADFWKRYYFLRHSVETAEARRRDLLRAASAEDEVGWGDDSDDETGQAKTLTEPSKRPPSTESSTTIHPPANTMLKPQESRKSNDEKSQADSDASYDVVGAASGNPSQAPNSPKDSRRGDESDEDWE